MNKVISSNRTLPFIDCTINPTNTSTNYYLDGCAPKLGEEAVGHSLGFVVINSILTVLGLATIPLLLALYDPADYADPPVQNVQNQAPPAYQPPSYSVSQTHPTMTSSSGYGSYPATLLSLFGNNGYSNGYNSASSYNHYPVAYVRP